MLLDASEHGRPLSLLKVDRSDGGVYLCSVNSQEYNLKPPIKNHPPLVTAERLNTVYQHPGIPFFQGGIRYFFIKS